MNKRGDIEERQRLTSSAIYETVAREGQWELRRPFVSLAWSGLVAGICISFSLFTMGFLSYYTPESPAFALLDKLGYTTGFLIVILSRFQLFTENTITVVLPLLERFSGFILAKVLKLWTTVLFFNLLGAFLVALLVSQLASFGPEQFEIFLDISRAAVDRNLAVVFIFSVPAGFLMAALVWMLPSSEGAEFWVILLMTYLIALGDFAHVIAGSVEAFLAMLGGQVSLAQGAGYLFMACFGNIIGGTGLFALTAYAQVREEI